MFTSSTSFYSLSSGQVRGSDDANTTNKNTTNTNDNTNNNTKNTNNTNNNP